MSPRKGPTVARRTMLEQEMYEAMVEQGVDEFSADFLARDAAVDMGEYDSETDVSEEAPEPELSGAGQWCRNCGHWWEIHRNGVGCLYEGCPCGVDADESAHAWTSNPEPHVSEKADR